MCSEGHRQCVSIYSYLFICRPCVNRQKSSLGPLFNTQSSILSIFSGYLSSRLVLPIEKVGLSSVETCVPGSALTISFVY